MFFLGLDFTSALLADPESTATQGLGCWCFSYWPLLRGGTAKASPLQADFCMGMQGDSQRAVIKRYSDVWIFVQMFVIERTVPNIASFRACFIFHFNVS